MKSLAELQQGDGSHGDAAVSMPCLGSFAFAGVWFWGGILQ